MKNTKLSPAQAYAAQVKADRRAAALERRATGAVVERQIDAMYGVRRNAQPKKQRASRAAWTAQEVDFLLDLYVKNVDLVNLTYDRGAIEAKFVEQFGNQHASSVHFILCQIKHLDAYYPANGMNSVSPIVYERTYALDPERFPGGATREEKVSNAIDALLAEIRA